MNEKDSTVRATSKDERKAAKRQAAQIFDRAVRHVIEREGDLTNKNVGAVLGISGTKVGWLRSDDESKVDVVPTIADILLADHDLAEFLLQEIRNERLKRHGVAPAVTPEQRLHRAMRRASMFTAKTSEALEDGALDDCEKPALDEERTQAIRELEALGPELATKRHGGRK